MSDPVEATEDAPEVAPEAPAAPVKKGAKAKKAKPAATEKKPAKDKKAKKPSAPAAHPKYSVMISAAIKALKDRNGSSRQAILKYITANYKVDPKKAAVQLRLSLKRAVASGNLKMAKEKGKGAGCFKLADKTENKPKTKPAKAKKPAAKKEKKAAKPKAAKKPTVKKPAVKKSAAKKSPKKATKKAAKKVDKK